MHNITKHLTRSTLEIKSEQDCKRAEKVWVQLSELFGKAHYRESGNTPPNLWIQAIKSLSDAQLMAGLANLGNDGLSFPPNLSQFIAACKRSKPVRQLGVKLLPMSDSEKKVNADKAWADMERLSGKKLR